LSGLFTNGILQETVSNNSVPKNFPQNNQITIIKNIPSKNNTSLQNNAIECCICYDMDNQFKSPTSTCSHKNDICERCIILHLDNQIRSTAVNIKCLKKDCNEHFNTKDDFRYIQLYNRWNAIQLLFYTQKDPNFRWCSKPDCGNGSLTDDSLNYFVCDKCGQKTCIYHRTEMHFGITCKAFDEMIKEKDITLLNSLYKKCPTCQSHIEKYEGCDHMKCRCGYEFCFLCLADYNEIRKHGNHKHRISCRYYAPYEESTIITQHHNRNTSQPHLPFPRQNNNNTNNTNNSDSSICITM